MQSGGIPPATRPGGGATKEEWKEEEVAGGSRTFEAAHEFGRGKAIVGEDMTYAAVVKQGPPPKVGGQPEGVAEGPSVAAPARKPTPFKRMDLTFIKPQLEEGRPIVDIPYSVTAAGEERWRHTLIGYVLGLNPNFFDMEGFVRGRWAELGFVRVHMMGRGLFVFQLETEEAKQAAMEMGPWSFSRRPLILRPWTVGMALEKPDVDSIPVWVQYPHLPIDLWTPEALSRITSQLGKPLFADRNTSEQRRLGYARVCVEIGVDGSLFEEVPVRYANGFIHYQSVTYEWLPAKCSKCKVFGHSDQGCRAVRVQVFVPKGDTGDQSSVSMLRDEVAVNGAGVKKDNGKSLVVERGLATSSGVVPDGSTGGLSDDDPVRSVGDKLPKVDTSAGGKLLSVVGVESTDRQVVKLNSELGIKTVSSGYVTPNYSGMLSGELSGQVPVIADAADDWKISRSVAKSSRISLTPVSRGNRFNVLSPVSAVDNVNAEKVAAGLPVLSDMVKQAGGLLTPTGTPMLIRQDIPRHAVDGQNCGTLLLDPVVEEEDEESDGDLETDLLKKVSVAFAQLAAGKQGSGGKRRKKGRRGRVAVFSPKLG